MKSALLAIDIARQFCNLLFVWFESGPCGEELVFGSKQLKENTLIMLMVLGGVSTESSASTIEHLCRRFCCLVLVLILVIVFFVFFIFKSTYLAESLQI
jgi:hypothetical protein